MRSTTAIVTLIFATAALPGAASAQRALSPKGAAALVEEFGKAVEKVNAKHAGKPGKATEADLRDRLPKKLLLGLDGLLAMEDSPEKWQALRGYGEAAAELALGDELERIEAALREGAPEAAAAFGHWIDRPRFLMHAAGVRDEFAEEFAGVFEGVLSGYDRTFAITEFSKVPGKKIRLLLHMEEKPGPPHFAPQYRWHSTIDFPISNDEAFTSPTADGKFLFYGLCHELGHVIAMWGDRGNEEDHHAWAHYTGIVVVEACSDEKWAKKLRDVRWRSVDVEEKELADLAPSFADRKGVLKLLLALHELVGAPGIGAALNRMDEREMGHRINHVRYYSMADLEGALVSVARSKKEAARIRATFSLRGGR